MHVRSISREEIGQFAAAGPHALGVEGFARYVESLWERGSSAPERCFVVEQDGEWIARVVYRGQGEEVGFFGLHLPWNGDYLSVGQMLFQESLSVLRKAGVHRLEAFTSSTWAEIDRIRAVMAHIGLPLVQEKRRYAWRDGDAVHVSGRLMYKTFHEVGENAFLDVIRRTSAGSLDRLDQLQRDELGEDQFAREYVNLLKNEFQFRPEWWLMAYTPGGQVAGFVIGVPYNAERNEGTIGYIGVLPEQRGHGYVNDLLAQSMAAMMRDGMTAFICDTDTLNVPMQQAFERRGYIHESSLWVYHGDLSRL
jgi:ribosomal protein S18 acetylase RimI-like enzyme